MDENIKLADDGMCFACGRKNTAGLGLVFELDSNNKLKTVFIPQKKHQGFADIVHGGIVGLILDEVMANLLWKLGKKAVTAEYTVRLKKMAKIGEKIIFTGWVTKDNPRIIYTEAKAENANGIIIATAMAKCIIIEQ